MTFTFPPMPSLDAELQLEGEEEEDQVDFPNSLLSGIHEFFFSSFFDGALGNVFFVGLRSSTGPAGIAAAALDSIAPERKLILEILEILRGNIDFSNFLILFADFRKLAGWADEMSKNVVSLKFGISLI